MEYMCLLWYKLKTFKCVMDLASWKKILKTITSQSVQHVHISSVNRGPYEIILVTISHIGDQIKKLHVTLEIMRL